MKDKNGIEGFYPQELMYKIIAEALEKDLKESDPLDERAYIVIRELSDAPVGTVLRPARSKGGEPSKKPEYENHYVYASSFVGRNTFLHKEIVETRTKWFIRIH